MYTLQEVSLISGLTERTLRNYLKQGILIGEKQDGGWRFTEEQITEFLSNDYVIPAVKAKQNAYIFDYLKNDCEKENTACVVLHLKKENPMKIASFFCEAVNKRQGLKMRFDHEKGENQVILVGSFDVVYDVLKEYNSKEK